MNCLSDMNIVIIKSFPTFNGIYCQQLTRVYLYFAMFVYDRHDHKLWNTARWQEPAFHKASDLTMIYLWSSCGYAPELSLVKYQLVAGQICTDLKQHFVAKKFSWWPGISSWIASFRIPIISTTRGGLFVKCLDWSLLYVEQHSDNLRKI